MRTRNLTLDICDYSNNVVCNIYDNKSDVSGQATDVVISFERNGWKELSFKLPSMCSGDNGDEENYRINFLVADYRIRSVDDNETDWFLISEPKITHNTFSKNVEVKAGHICQLLRTKKLDLEFSDDEGNNVGTAEEILTTILDGTDWTPGNVYDFRENDNTVKKRSMNTPAKSGAFKMIEDLCNLFEAKAVYHGNSKTVDIVPMNPFSKSTDGKIPKEVLDGQNVLELHYDKNVFNISRTDNTENIITKLYAYGAYGDANLGMCSIQTCSHKEYHILSLAPSSAGTEIKFTVENDTYYFTPAYSVEAATEFIWSKLDFASQMYVWDTTNNKACRVYKKPNSLSWPSVSLEEEVVQNYIPFLLNFNYYDKIGLFTNEMLDEVAEFQRTQPNLYKTSTEIATEFNDNLTELSKVAESNTGFLKLDISKFYETDNTDSEHTGLLRLRINKTTYPTGVIYRSDYIESRKNYFQWYVASELKPNGLPVSGIGSVLFVVHPTTPVTYNKFYLKTIWDDNGNIYQNSEGNAGAFNYKEHTDEPAKITLWTQDNNLTWMNGDRYYLFCTDSMSGMLGEKTAEVETLINSIGESTKEATKEGTVNHTLIFVSESDAEPSTEIASVNYGWYYRYRTSDFTEGELYLCWGEKNEISWHRVYVQNEIPEIDNDSYYLNRKDGKFYHCERNNWVLLDTQYEKNCAKGTAVVYHKALTRDLLYNGLYEKYTYIPDNRLVAGNYAFKNEFDYYYLFTTHQDVEVNGSLVLDTIKGSVWPDDDIDHISTYITRQVETLTFMKENEIDPSTYFHGDIDQSGTYINSSTKYVSNYIIAYENTVYEYVHPAGYAYFYNVNKKYLSAAVMSGTNFTTPPDTRYIRISCSQLPSSSSYVHVYKYFDKLFIGNKMYTILENTGSGIQNGINNLVKNFADLADDGYTRLLSNLMNAQETIKENDKNLSLLLGDILRENIWQDEKYVEGDEDKLYADAMDNLEEIAQPEYSYDFTFLDLYGANKNQGYELDEDEPAWPDIQITDAAHLIDPDIDTNRWAYIDKLDKCYDQEWKTKVDINTRLSLIGQHDFSDLLARIAEVASLTKGKQSLYARAAYLTSAGYLATEKLEGSLKVAKNAILGGSSSWYTDDRGRIIFESTDGNYAMMMSGAGLLISNSKDEWGDWNWKTALTGSGLVADEVVTAFLSAKEALIGSITTDMISAAVGNELEISSNKALLLYATEDGTRPAGSLRTTDSLIEIVAGNTAAVPQTPARINIMSGGEVNLKAGTPGETGGKLNIESYGELNIKSGADMTIEDNGNLFINAGGKIDIKANSTFLLDSTNLKVKPDGSVEITGTVTANAGSIAGFTIDEHVNQTTGQVDRRYIYSGTSSLVSTANGVYIGTDGVNFGGGKFVVSSDGNIVTLSASANNIILETPGGSSITLNDKLESIVTSAGNHNYLQPTDPLEDNPPKPVVSGDYWIKTNGTNEDLTWDDVRDMTWNKVKDKTWFQLMNNIEAIYCRTGGNPGAWVRVDSIDKISEAYSRITQNFDSIEAEVRRASAAEGELRSLISITADEIKAEVSRASGIEGRLSSQISITADKIAAEVSRANTAEGELSARIIVAADAIATEVTRAQIAENGKVSIGTSSYQTADAIVTAAESYTNNKLNSYSTTTQTDEMISSYVTNNAYKQVSGITITASGIDISGSQYVRIASEGYFQVTTGNFGINTNSSTYVLWSGASTAANSLFWIKKDGSIKATSGTIGGWTINENSLSGGSGTSNVVLNMDTSTSNVKDYAMWAGNSLPTGTNAAPFRVTRAGKLYASGAEISGNSTFSGTLSANCLTSGTIDASAVTVTNINASNINSGSLSASRISGGTLTLGGSSNGNGTLRINNASGSQIGSWTNSGISATAGSIGGWTINTKNLSVGSGASTICLNADTETTTNSIKDYAFWVGASTPGSAPFRVKRDGSVYLTQLKIIKENTDGTKSEETVNLTSNDNRLRGGTITGWGAGSNNSFNIYTTYGTINFNTAASVDWVRPTGWSGNTYTVTLSNGKARSTAIDDVQSNGSITASSLGGTWYNLPVVVKTDEEVTILTDSVLFNAEPAHTAGKSAYYNSSYWDRKVEKSGSTWIVHIPNVTATAREPWTVDASDAVTAGATTGWGEAVSKIGTLAVDNTDWVYIDLPAANYGGTTGQSLDVGYIRQAGIDEGESHFTEHTATYRTGYWRGNQIPLDLYYKSGNNYAPLGYYAYQSGSWLGIYDCGQEKYYTKDS